MLNILQYFFAMNIIYIFLQEEEIEPAPRVEILDRAVCVSHSTYGIGKGMNPRNPQI